MRSVRIVSVVIATSLIAAASGISWIGTSDASFTGGNGRIVFGRETVAGNHTQVDLYTARPDGTHRVQLTDTPNHNEFGATWNAQGTQVAFWRTKAPFGPGSLWVMNANGSSARKITSGIDARDPSWNPDGTRLVFTNVTDNWNLWMLDASDGGNLTPLTSGKALDFEPTWEPAGTQVMFTRGRSRGDPGNIWVIDITSGVEIQVTRGAAYDHQATFSPDSKYLYFERDFSGSSAIYALDIDGSVPKRLTFGVHFDTSPAVSPDGDFIVFSTSRRTTLSDLWLMNVDGTHQHAFVTLKSGEGEPDWQPVSP